MATESNIGLSLADNFVTIKYIYCAFDGTCKHTGLTLINHYNTLDKVKKTNRIW